MQNIKRLHSYTVDIAKPLTRQSCGLLLASGDKSADEFRFKLMQNGVELIPSATQLVTAYFMRQDGETVIIQGANAGSLVSVVLPQSCYVCEGHFTLTVKVTDYPSTITTVAVLDGFVRKTTTDVLVDPGKVVPTAEELFSDEAVGSAINNYFASNPVQLTPVFAQSVDECKDTSLAYVLPDGYVYAYMWGVEGLPEITYELGEGGYWGGNTGYETGQWREAECGSKRTNVFAVTPGDVLSYRGGTESSAYSVFWLDASQGFLSREQISAKASAVEVTAPANAGYVWFQSLEYNTPASNVILDVKWITCQAATTSYHWMNTGHKFIAGGSEGVSDVLNGKKIVYDGDSIAETRANNGGGYPQIIANLVGGTYENHAHGGGRLTSSTSRHSVVDNLSSLPLDGDLYCFEGGINDYWGDVPIGTCTYGDYTGTLDKTTICGAMETIFRHCLNTFVGKPVCFVIVHKVQETGWKTNGNGNTFKDYRDAMVMVCEKYSIPYYDAFTESGLNGWNSVQSAAYLTANGNGTADGIHPNEAGYRRYYVPQLLAKFRHMMTV